MEIYLRKETSWRRMLLKQPPSNKITVVGSLYLDTQSLIPSQLALRPLSDWCRLGDLYSGIEQGVILPTRDPFVFLCVVHPHADLDPKLRPPWSTVPISKLLFDCDVVFFHRGTRFTVSPWVDFEDWLWSLGKFDLEHILGGDFDDNWRFGFPGLRRSLSEYLEKSSHSFFVDLAFRRRIRTQVAQPQSDIHSS
jgi:hypothetical protein